MHNEVKEILRKRQNQPWPKYVKGLSIAGLRGWTGQQVKFNFPVCAISGENGSGKSTILQAAAVAYNQPSSQLPTFFPSTFFPDTAWERCSGVELKYEITEGTTTRNYGIRKKTERWRFQQNKPKRHVIWQDISRTLPISSTVGFAYLAKRSATEVSAKQLDPQMTRNLSEVLGKSYSSAWFGTANLDQSREVGVLQLNGQTFSQFHQGAGEDTTLDLFFLLQNIPDTTLLIIDEVEASLHPKSQQRLVHFLLYLARIKHIQVIMSTHSPYILEELPEEGRIFIQRNQDGVNILYGVSPAYALSKMDDIDTPELYLFTEDKVATVFLNSLLRYCRVDVTRTRCIEVGPASVVAALGIAGANRALPFPSISILDGDQPQSKGCIKLPGDAAPERVVFLTIRDQATHELCLRLGKSEQSIIDTLDQAIVLTDHHQWISYAARLLGETDSYLWTTMCKVWVEHCCNPAEICSLVSSISAELS